MATVNNADWPKEASAETTTQQQELLHYLESMEHANLNALMFHVRPCGDAFYDHSIEPWSAFLTGKQGVAPNPVWDPLEFVIQAAHSRGIDVHAWVNPFRANVKPTWDGLAANHMAVRFKEFAYPYGDFLWMDPGAHAVQEWLLLVVQDILDRCSSAFR